MPLDSCSPVLKIVRLLSRHLIASIFPLVATQAIGASDYMDYQEPSAFAFEKTSIKSTEFGGEECFQLICDPIEVEDLESYVCYARVAELNDFSDGVIEVDLASLPSRDLVDTARGFAGLAFRIDEAEVSKFESFYVRPTNGRVEDQIRRNHAVQYMSSPDYRWFKTRRETPGKYESYADMQPGVWMHLKIEVEGAKARFYVDDMEQPVLVVNDLKHGAGHAGSVGIWTYPSTDAYFKNFRVSKN